eukprot:scaffold45495_cov41-Prasinocladus_malaysianus.AAC.1
MPRVGVIQARHRAGASLSFGCRGYHFGAQRSPELDVCLPPLPRLRYPGAAGMCIPRPGISLQGVLTIPVLGELGDLEVLGYPVHHPCPGAWAIKDVCNVRHPCVDQAGQPPAPGVLRLVAELVGVVRMAALKNAGWLNLVAIGHIGPERPAMAPQAEAMAV